MIRRAPVARLLCLVFPVLLYAGHQQASPQNGSVDGAVSDSNSGEPLAGVSLHLFALRYARGGRQSQPQATSGADGAFHFDSVTPGSYVITAEHSGYVAKKLNSKSQLITVSPGQALTGITVSLAREGVITGIVEDESGTPLPGVHVQALAAVTTYGQTSLKLFANTDADRQGKFVLSGLPANSYYVLAKPTKPASDKDGDLVQTFYPRALELDGAGSVPVGSGETVNDIAIRVRRAATYHIRGKIAELSAQSGSSRLAITVLPAGAANSLVLGRKIAVGATRAFDIPGLVPGVYTLRLTTDGGESPGRNHSLLARQDVEVGGGDVTGVVLSPMPALSVTGQIRVDSSSNAALPMFTVSARPLEDISHGALGFAKIAADGSFSLTNLDPGLYIVQARPSAAGWYVKSMTLNGQDVLNKQADLSDISTARLDIVVSPGAGQVNVTVLSNSSSDSTNTDAGNSIVLAPEAVGPDGSGVLFGFARQNASFSFKSVRPGKYFCYAVQQGDPNLWQNPDFLQAVQSLGTPLDVGENSSEQLQVKVLPLDQVEQAAARVGFQLQ